MNFALDAWTIGAILLLAGLAFWGVRMLKQRVEEQRYQEHMADLEFESNLLTGNQGLLASGNDAVFMQSSDPKTTAPPPQTETKQSPIPDFSEQVAHVPNAGSSLEPVPAEVKARAVFDKLQHAGMVRGIEGYIEVHGNAKGAAILRLRDGKLALLVPAMESEAFLRHHQKRVDLIIMVGHGDSAFVVRPIEQLLADGITF